MKTKNLINQAEGYLQGEEDRYTNELAHWLDEGNNVNRRSNNWSQDILFYEGKEEEMEQAHDKVEHQPPYSFNLYRIAPIAVFNQTLFVTLLAVRDNFDGFLKQYTELHRLGFSDTKRVCQALINHLEYFVTVPDRSLIPDLTYVDVFLALGYPRSEEIDNDWNRIKLYPSKVTSNHFCGALIALIEHKRQQYFPNEIFDRSQYSMKSARSNEKPDDLIKVTEAAKVIGKTPQTVHGWINKGDLEKYFIGASSVRHVSKAELLAVHRGRRGKGNWGTQTTD